MKQTKGSLEILQKLLEFDMFHPLRLEQLADMEKMVSRIELNVGEILMEEGMVSGCFYLVEKGNVEVYFSVPGQKDYLEACRLKIGSPVGEMALLEDDVHSARVVAKKSSSLIKIENEAFLNFCRLHPDVGFEVMRYLAKLLSNRLRYTDQFVRHVVSKD